MRAMWVALLYASILLITSAGAAEFRVYNGNLYLWGPIVSGDFGRFQNALKTSVEPIGTVELRSPGGDVANAIQIGRVVRKLYLATDAPSTVGVAQHCAADPEFVPHSMCLCASACVLIWAGGVMRWGDDLLIHRIKYDKNFFASLDPANAATLYKAGLEAIHSYFSDVDIPDSIYERMKSIPSSIVIKLTYEEANALSEPPSFGEWMAARCGDLTGNEPARVACMTRSLRTVRDVEMRKFKAGGD